MWTWPIIDFYESFSKISLNKYALFWSLSFTDEGFFLNSWCSHCILKFLMVNVSYFDHHHLLPKTRFITKSGKTILKNYFNGNLTFSLVLIFFLLCIWSSSWILISIIDLYTFLNQYIILKLTRMNYYFTFDKKKLFKNT